MHGMLLMSRSVLAIADMIDALTAHPLSPEKKIIIIITIIIITIIIIIIFIFFFPVLDQRS